MAQMNTPIRSDLQLDGEPITAHLLNSSRMGEVWVMKQAMRGTDLAQWFTLTKLTEENAAEEKLRVPKTDRSEVEQEKPDVRTTERPNPRSETTLIEVSSNAVSETTSIVE